MKVLFKNYLEIKNRRDSAGQYLSTNIFFGLVLFKHVSFPLPLPPFSPKSWLSIFCVSGPVLGIGLQRRMKHSFCPQMRSIIGIFRNHHLTAQTWESWGEECLWHTHNLWVLRRLSAPPLVSPSHKSCWVGDCSLPYTTTILGHLMKPNRIF